MKIEKFRWLAGVIAAHPERKVVGRTRIQKTIYLLQQKGLPTGFNYTMHHYGPYSTDLSVDIQMLEDYSLIHEEVISRDAWTNYSIYTAIKEVKLDEMEPYQQWIDLMNDADSVALELAATYTAYRKVSVSPEDALERLRQKKTEKCTPEKLRAAMELLRDLNLEYNTKLVA
jgi:uncharacterized protein YwgA